MNRSTSGAAPRRLAAGGPGAASVPRSRIAPQVCAARPHAPPGESRPEALRGAEAQGLRRIRERVQGATGIRLGPEKHALVMGRLDKRLRALGIDGYAAYADLLAACDGSGELQAAVDLLSTNETFFFREPAHFGLLAAFVRGGDAPGRRWRIWSAACASGEEAYSIAMTLADAVGDRFEVLGSDISLRVLERAARAHYPMQRMEHFPQAHLRSYCLRGVGPQTGTLLIDRALRARVSFRRINLIRPLPVVGRFDAVFLRNALIYFDRETKTGILRRVGATLVPGGRLFVSHSESLHGLAHDFVGLHPGVYRRSAE